MGVAWKQLGMVRQKGKQVSCAATAVCKEKTFSIGLKPKNLSIDASYFRGKDSWYKQSF